MHAASGQSLAHCPACRKSPELRRIWGCDAESPLPLVYSSSCPQCLGTEAACETCRGAGEIKHRRCPQSMATQDGWRVVRALRNYQNGFLPGPGSINDQPAKLMKLIDIAGREASLLQDAALKEARGNG